MGPQFAFLALKIIFVTMLRWDSKTDFDQYIAKKNITYIYSTILSITYQETIQKCTPYSVPPKINEEKLRKEIKNTEALIKVQNVCSVHVKQNIMLAELAQ